MGAPIFRYSDARLYGHLLTQPHEAIYNTCFKNFSNPVHPRHFQIVEYATRVLKATIGLIGMLLLSPLTLMGRLSQITHYHCLSDTDRDQPEAVDVRGITLPKLKPLNNYATCYHGTNNDAAASICSTGLRLSRSGALGSAAYVSNDKDAANKNYGQAGGVFTLHMDVDPREIANLDLPIQAHYGEDWMKEADRQCRTYCNFNDEEFSEEKFQSSIRELFLNNGYRAIGYEANVGDNGISAIAVYDTSILSIQNFEVREGLGDRGGTTVMSQKRVVSS